MNWPFFASFILFCILLSFEISRHTKHDRRKQEQFWEEEAKANRTGRRSLDQLEYITIPESLLALRLPPDDPAAQEYLEALQSLSDSPIVNLTGYTNTELKLAYGAPNINLLTRYDQNYTMMVRTLQKWADLLYRKGYRTQAQELLTFAVSTHTDVSGTYRLLSEIYREQGCPDKIKELVPIAQSLNSMMREPIVRMLQESDP